MTEPPGLPSCTASPFRSGTSHFVACVPVRRALPAAAPSRRLRGAASTVWAGRPRERCPGHPYLISCSLPFRVKKNAPHQATGKWARAPGCANAVAPPATWNGKSHCPISLSISPRWECLGSAGDHTILPTSRVTGQERAAWVPTRGPTTDRPREPYVSREEGSLERTASFTKSVASGTDGCGARAHWVGVHQLAAHIDGKIHLCAHSH